MQLQILSYTIFYSFSCSSITNNHHHNQLPPSSLWSILHHLTSPHLTLTSPASPQTQTHTADLHTVRFGLRSSLPRPDTYIYLSFSILRPPLPLPFVLRQLLSFVLHLVHHTQSISNCADNHFNYISNSKPTNTQTRHTGRRTDKLQLVLQTISANPSYASPVLPSESVSSPCQSTTLLTPALFDNRSQSKIRMSSPTESRSVKRPSKSHPLVFFLVLDAALS